MGKRKRGKTYWTAAWVLMVLLIHNGCSGVIQIRGTAGDNLRAISVGTPREHVERILGLPEKTCTRPANDKQVIWYFYDEGQLPGSIWSSSLIDLNYYACVIATLGLCDLAFSSLMLYTNGLNGLIKVEFDTNDQVTGYHRYSHNDLNANWGPKGFSSGILECEQ